jgi:hypothetical protein
MMSLAIVPLFVALLGGGPDLRSDETVTFFPTYAALNDDNTVWKVHIHGWIYEPENNSIKRRIALGLFRKFLGLPENSALTDHFRRRAHMFLVENKDDRMIGVHIGQTTFHVGPSGENGHMQALLDVPVANLASRNAVHVYTAVLPPGDNRTFTGEFLPIPPAGVSVISDIDDTIKITDVLNRKTLIANTFMLDYKPVPGMAGVYRRWADQGAAFHYVSGSPWQLYPALSDFLARNGFPKGSLHLRNFRWLDSSALDLFGPPEKMKLQTIAAILQDFPHRRFILIGDTTERDPEIYGHFARLYPEQIRRIYIRNVTGESADSDRFKKAFQQIPADAWTLFTTPEALPSSLLPAKAVKN